LTKHIDYRSIHGNLQLNLVKGNLTLFPYSYGFVIEEQAVQPAPGQLDPKYNLSHRDERIDKEKYPLAHAAGAVMFADQNTRFLEGAHLIVQGMSASCPSAMPQV
jgi:hypothetical protein